VAGPNHVKVMQSVRALYAQRIRINKAYLVSCVNGRAEDLAQAARVLRGRRLADHVKMYVAAASSEVQQQAEARGDWGALIAAGATPLPAGCGPCVGICPPPPPRQRRSSLGHAQC
jgi:homoaconitate hydratase